jgi:glycosyltransferase involved in cell wall biosynthesis
VFNRAELLASVLAGLSVQTVGGFDVIVVDDGSEEPIIPVVAAAEGLLDVTLLRQERDGFGTHRARNLAVSRSEAEIVAFLDADCIPAANWLERHLWWHQRASNLVVTGSRRHIDVLLEAEDIRTGAVDLHQLASQPEREREPFEPDDWRRVLYRRSQRLLLGDAAYRAVIGCNSSMWRDRYREAGGTSEDFRGWGGEDSELAWRVWNAGAFVVPEDRAMIYHQRALDPTDGLEKRLRSRDRALALIADRVPHRFYRKEPSHLYTVPKVSWLAPVADEAEADEVWHRVSDMPYTDTELVLIGDEDALGSRASAAAGRDLSVVPTFRDGVLAARGEVLAIVDSRSQYDRRLLGRAMRRFRDSRVSAVRVAYRSGSQRILRLRDLRRIDQTAGRSGLPFFGLIKRRELMKDRAALANPGDAWSEALDRSRTELLIANLVDIPADIASEWRERLPGPAEVKAAGRSAVIDEYRKAIRSEPPDQQDSETAPSSSDTAAAGTGPVSPLVGVEYVGLAGHHNLGDDAMLEAIRRLMPWAEVGTNLANPRAVMLGGGTLLNADNYYLNKVRRVDGPNEERVVFGTGVRSPEYWGFTEQLEDWEPFLRSALSIGLRGPDSLATIRSWGYDGPVDVVGDPALVLPRPEGVENVEGRVVISPVYTAGECWGGDDGAVFDEFAAAIGRLRSSGRDVVMMTAHPGDDRWAIEIMRRAGHPDLPYLAGYEDLDAALRLLASADLVIGERLHAVVLAAAMGTPFIAVEYRPKVRDFMSSLGAAEWCTRTDEMGRLGALIDERLEADVGDVAQVGELRLTLQNRAAEIASDLGVGGGS